MPLPRLTPAQLLEYHIERFNNRFNNLKFQLGYWGDPAQQPDASIEVLRRARTELSETYDTALMLREDYTETGLQEPGDIDRFITQLEAVLRGINQRLGDNPYAPQE
jgi:pyruvate-formate lyase-activating enzyme